MQYKTWKAIDEALSELEGRVGLPDFAGLADEIRKALHLFSLQGELIDERKERLEKAIFDHKSEVVSTMRKRSEDAALYTPQVQEAAKARCAELSDAVRMALIEGDIQAAAAGIGEIDILHFSLGDARVKLQEDVDRLKAFRQDEEYREMASHLKPVRDLKAVASCSGRPRIVVSWIPESSGLATGYRIVRESSQSNDATKSFDCITSPLIDTDIASGVPYKYTVLPCYRGVVALENVAMDTPMVISTAPEVRPTEISDDTNKAITTSSVALHEKRIGETKSRKCKEPEETFQNPAIAKTIILPGGAEMEMIFCPPGQFVMGNRQSQAKQFRDENQHIVKLTKGFWMGKYPVTRAQWKSVMGWPSSSARRDEWPVVSVSWDDCQEFIKNVNTSLDCEARLPTEAEWEYACRAGTTGDYGGTGRLDEMGWFSYNSGAKPHPVGKKKPNAWGLYDMHGNVGEWCADRYGAYPKRSVTDPTGPTSGYDRVYRGGGWDKFPSSCRSAHRDHGSPSHKDDDLGFRLCCGFCVDAVPDKTSWQAQEICDQVLREEDTLEDVQKPSVKVVIKVTSVQKSKDDNPRDNIVTIPTSGRSDELVTAQSLYDEAENYYRGQHGVKEDRVKAFKLYQIAAQLGNPDAQYSVGYMYANGDSVARDYAKGLFWYRKAAMQGHEKAGRLANGLAERMKDGM